MSTANLFAALADGDTGTVGKMIQKSGDTVKKKDRHGNTPLHKAAEDGHLGIAKQLFKAGADVNAIDNYGSTALHFAVHNVHDEIVRFLIRRDAATDVCDDFGNSPLSYAMNNAKDDKVDQATNTKIIKMLRKPEKVREEDSDEEEVPKSVSPEDGLPPPRQKVAKKESASPSSHQNDRGEKTNFADWISGDTVEDTRLASPRGDIVDADESGFSRRRSMESVGSMPALGPFVEAGATVEATAVAHASAPAYGVPMATESRHDGSKVEHGEGTLKVLMLPEADGEMRVVRALAPGEEPTVVLSSASTNVSSLRDEPRSPKASDDMHARRVSLGQGGRSQSVVTLSHRGDIMATSQTAGGRSDTTGVPSLQHAQTMSSLSTEQSPKFNSERKQASRREVRYDNNQATELSVMDRNAQALNSSPERIEVSKPEAPYEDNQVTMRSVMARPESVAETPAAAHARKHIGTLPEGRDVARWTEEMMRRPAVGTDDERGEYTLRGVANTDVWNAQRDKGGHPLSGLQQANVAMARRAEDANLAQWTENMIQRPTPNVQSREGYDSRAAPIAEEYYARSAMSANLRGHDGGGSSESRARVAEERSDMSYRRQTSPEPSYGRLSTTGAPRHREASHREASPTRYAEFHSRHDEGHVRRGERGDFSPEGSRGAGYSRFPAYTPENMFRILMKVEKDMENRWLDERDRREAFERDMERRYQDERHRRQELESLVEGSIDRVSEVLKVNKFLQDMVFTYKDETNSRLDRIEEVLSEMQGHIAGLARNIKNINDSASARASREREREEEKARRERELARERERAEHRSRMEAQIRPGVGGPGLRQYQKGDNTIPLD